MTALKLLVKHISLCTVIFALTVLYGCAETTYKKYDFKDITQEHKGGVVKIRFMGTEYSEEKLNTRKGPYKIIVTIKANDSNAKNATITKLEIENNKVAVFQTSALTSDFKKFSDGSLNAQFQIPDVEMTHVSHSLNLEFKDSTGQSYKLNSEVSPEYSEQKSNSILERLLGV